jgi:hypothetical protein
VVAGNALEALADADVISLVAAATRANSNTVVSGQRLARNVSYALASPIWNTALRLRVRAAAERRKR